MPVPGGREGSGPISHIRASGTLALHVKHLSGDERIPLLNKKRKGKKKRGGKEKKRKCIQFQFPDFTEAYTENQKKGRYMQLAIYIFRKIFH